MREFVVSEAPRDRVAALARATVEDVGGVVAQATERATEFDHLEPAAGDWSRSGYVGTYKRYGEPPVRLRIRVWAAWPRKLFLWSVFLGLVQAVVFFSMALIGLSPPSNVWIFSAILTFALIAIGLLMFTSSWADSREIEDEIARRLTAELSDDEEVPGDVYTLGEWEAYRARVIDQAVEQAEAKAPERPSRSQRVLERVGIAGGDEDAEPEQSEPEIEPAIEAGSDAGEEPDEDEEDEDEDASLLDRVAFWRSGEEDEEPDEGEADEEPVEEPEAEPAVETEPDEEPEDEADDEGILDRVAFWRSSDEEDEDAEDEQEAPDEEVLEAEDEAEEEPDEPGEDDEDESGLLDRVAFWKGDDEDDDAEDDEGDEDEGEAPDGADEDPEVAEKRKRLEELKRKKEAAETDDSG